MIARWAGTTLITAATVAGAVAVANSAPALTAITPLRRRLLPGLAGLGDRRHLALTFDDGPHPETTPAVLDILRTHDVRVTFFVLGSALARRPDLGRRILDEGHEIAMHGHEHALLLYRRAGAVRDDLTRAYELIAEITGVAPRWYRPPYGVLTTAALLTARRLGLTPILWSTWGRDWTRYATPATVLRTAQATLTGGGTVLLHDSDEYAFPGASAATLGALPHLIRYARRSGLTIGPLSEHGLTEHRPRHYAQ